MNNQQTFQNEANLTLDLDELLDAAVLEGVQEKTTHETDTDIAL